MAGRISADELRGYSAAVRATFAERRTLCSCSHRASLEPRTLAAPQRHPAR